MIKHTYVNYNDWLNVLCFIVLICADTVIQLVGDIRLL